ncbi:MAG: ComEA family DNA-binding protein, partial [Actinoallomurus sp.]
PSGLPPPPRTRPDMPVRPRRPRTPAPHDGSLPPERLRVLLGTAIMRQVSLGWRIESQFANYAVMATGGEVNHAVHALATMLTCGVWMPVWVILGVTGSEKHVIITVAPNGAVLFDGLPAQGPPPVGRTPRGPVVRPWRGNANADAIAAATMRRNLRQAAREQAEQDLALARDLRIGRPDLPREYDDGGLIDVNHVPPPALTLLSGVTTEIAERIVATREHVGLFTSAEELVITADLHPDLMPEIKEYGIFLP